MIKRLEEALKVIGLVSALTISSTASRADSFQVYPVSPSLKAEMRTFDFDIGGKALFEEILRNLGFGRSEFYEVLDSKKRCSEATYSAAIGNTVFDKGLAYGICHSDKKLMKKRGINHSNIEKFFEKEGYFFNKGTTNYQGKEVPTVMATPVVGRETKELEVLYVRPDAASIPSFANYSGRGKTPEKKYETGVFTKRDGLRVLVIDVRYAEEMSGRATSGWKDLERNAKLCESEERCNPRDLALYSELEGIREEARGDFAYAKVLQALRDNELSKINGMPLRKDLTVYLPNMN